jgi:hypothetical protein
MGLKFPKNQPAGKIKRENGCRFEGCIFPRLDILPLHIPEIPTFLVPLPATEQFPEFHRTLVMTK